MEKQRKNKLPTSATAPVTLSVGLVSAAIMAALAAPAGASSGPGVVEAKVVNDFGVNEQQALDFGTFALVNPASTGAFTLQTNDSVVGLVNALQVGGSSPASGVFRIASLTPGGTFVISTTGAGSAVIKNTASTDSMTVNQFRIGCGDFSGPTSVSATGVSCTATGAQNTGDFRVGAKLNFGANQAQGTYTGTYNIIVTKL